MKHLKHSFFESLEYIEKKSLWNAWDGKAFPRKKFLSILKQAHPFIFDRKCTEEAQMEAGVDGEAFVKKKVPLEWSTIVGKAKLVEEFSLPRSTSLYLFTEGPRICRFDVKKEVVVFQRIGFLIHEISPEKILVFDLSRVRVDDYKGKAELKLSRNPSSEGFWVPVVDVIELDLLKFEENFASDIVSINRLTNMLSVKRLGIEKKLSCTIKTRDFGTGYTMYKYDNLIHIADKEEYEYTKPLGEGIDWEYRGFWRGHWRALYFSDDIVDSFGRRVVDYTRLGKNRSEEYNVPGYTWVVEHTKGDPAFAQIKTHLVKK